MDLVENFNLRRLAAGNGSRLTLWDLGVSGWSRYCLADWQLGLRTLPLNIGMTYYYFLIEEIHS